MHAPHTLNAHHLCAITHASVWADSFWNVLELCFTGAFFVEMCLKLTALGWGEYTVRPRTHMRAPALAHTSATPCSHGACLCVYVYAHACGMSQASLKNNFDAFVTVVTVGVTAVVYIPNSISNSKIIRYVLALRLLRLLRLMNSFPQVPPRTRAPTHSRMSVQCLARVRHAAWLVPSSHDAFAPHASHAAGLCVHAYACASHMLPQVRFISETFLKMAPEATQLLKLLFTLVYAFSALGIGLFGGLINTDPDAPQAALLANSSFGQAVRR